MTGSIRTQEKIKIFHDVNLNDNSAVAVVNCIGKLGNVSIQVDNAGSGSSVKFTYKMSNDWNPDNRTGTFTTCTSGDVFGTVAGDETDFLFDAIPVCHYLQIIDYEWMEYRGNP